ncbi:GNAT family N-acetyltransferase [Rhodospirillum sp. A1_3_36]|uniref:GNAT family N-acetyltransferase n=1 Tax=Rhodospirillum sp. A1_3_36 TaxID=3391666 RepID=UPI0039A42F7B
MDLLARQDGIYTLSPLDLSQPNPGVGSLTYPRYRLWFDGAEPAPDTLRATVALAAGLPVGLVVIQRRKSEAVRVLSLMVSRPFRRQGIGRALLGAAEDTALSQGAQALEAHWSSRVDRTAFMALLDNCGWSAPDLLERRLAGHADWPKRMGPGWEGFLEVSRRNGYTATPWTEITPDDRSRALELEAAEAPEDWPVFTKFEPHADPHLSVALRHHGDLVGWIHCETRLKEGYHHYVTGYVKRTLQGKGWLAAGLDTVCRRQAEIYGQHSVAVLETPGSNTRMIAFMERRLRPVSLWIDDVYRSTKTLSPQV